MPTNPEGLALPTAPGTKFGPYTVIEHIGAGGMGEVWKARDTRLNRIVAIKTSQSNFTERFSREALAIAAINHPNICTLYDIGPDYLVMEYVEGAQLKGPLVPDLALKYAIQLAGALEAAHRHRVTHRDLKPANILITKSGVKVLDFGLATISRPALAESDETESFTQSLTMPGTIVGTLKYMAPEQLRGAKADARTDIFAFGCVLYEMLTGTHAFDGGSKADVISAILEHEPAQPAASLPPTIEWILRRCLAKDPDARWQTATDLRAALELVAQGMTLSEGSHKHSGLTATNRVLPAVAAILAVALTVTGGFLWRTTRTENGAATQDLRITQLTSTGTASAPAISGDGKYVVYTQTDGNDDESLWVRQINTASQVRIVAVEHGMRIPHSAVTPDGAFIDFVRASATVIFSELWRVPFLGGPSKKILDSNVVSAGWSPDGKQIAFTRRLAGDGSLMLADADGGHERKLYSPPDYVQIYYGSAPAWSPDGRLVAFLANTELRAGGAQRVFVVDAKGAARELKFDLSFQTSLGLGLGWLDAGNLVVTGAASDGVPSQLWRLSYPDGRLSPLTNDLSNYIGVSLTSDRRSLVTARLDSRVGVWMGAASGASGDEVIPFANGPVNFARVAWAGERLLHTTSANGRLSIGALDGRTMSDDILASGLHHAATPDGRYVVFTSTDGDQNGTLWRIDADGRHPFRLVSRPAIWAAVTPDSQNVVFVSDSGPQRLWTVSINGGIPRQLSDVFAYYPDVSPDGKSILFGRSNVRGELGICELPACATVRKVTTPRGGPVSKWTPDGKGIAYFDVGRGGNLRVQPLDGSPSKQLTHFNDDRIIRDFAWSADGKRLAVIRSALSTDVVLFRGLRGGAAGTT